MASRSFLGHQTVDCVLHRGCDAGTEIGASLVATVGGLGELEDEVVSGTLERGMVLVELDQLGQRLRIQLAGHRVRPVRIGPEIRRDVPS
jgi:hypothetical protein